MNVSLRTTICIPPTHPSLPGHFPGKPVVPAVLLLDAVAEQLALQGRRLDAVIEAKFHRPLPPGVDVTLELVPAGEAIWQFRIEGADGIVARGRVRSTMR